MKKLSSKVENEKRLMVLSVENNNWLRSESIKQDKSVNLVVDKIIRKFIKDQDTKANLVDKIKSFIADVEGEL